ncbi:MAG: hypothetical protein ACLFUJ_07495 [Phycisphaerae bacterium]
MIEFFSFAFSASVALFSILTVVLLIYWSVVVLGLAGTDLFDIDLDVDVDVDGEVDATEISSVGGPMEAMLTFFYVGQVPVMILLSILIFSSWIGAMLLNYEYNHPADDLRMGLLLAAASLGIGLAAVKVVGWPLGRLFSVLNDEHGARNLKLTGRMCSVLSTVTSERMGQAEIRAGGAPIVISVLSEGEVAFHRGDEALVFDHDKNRNVYLIAPVELER